MNKSSFAMLATVLVTLSACNLAPPYQRPAAPVPGQWPAAADAAGVRTAAEVDWPVFYADPRLRGLIEAALVHNRDLRVATARIAEARALYGVQRADRLPTVNAGASGSRARLPADLSSSGRAMVTERYDVNLGATAFELDFWGRVANLSEAALANYLTTEQAQRSVRLSLIAEVADAYFTVEELDRRLALSAETLRARAESRTLIDKRREVGLAGDLDFLAADGAYQAAQVDRLALERQRTAADNALRVLVGAWPENLPTALSLEQQALAFDLVPEVPSTALLRRPDVMAAEQQLIAANANIGAARAAFLPRISLTAAFGTASHALSGLFDGGSEAWSFQPVLSLPLFDAGRVRANVDLAEARKEVAVAQYEKTLQQAFREVADLLAARDQLRRQLSAQQAAERSQSERLRLTEARYRGGVANYLELLDAQRDYFSAQQASVQLHRQLLAAVNQLYKALGGGRT